MYQYASRYVLMDSNVIIIMYYIYYSAFKLYRYGYGDAMGVVLAIIIAILSAIQFKLGNTND